MATLISISRRIAILFLVLLSFFNCKSTKEQTTGWSYNEPVSDDFDKPQSNLKKLPKLAAKYFKDMILIREGSFTMGRIAGINPLDQDSTLLQTFIPRRVTISSFYISDHEVTNEEYREFVYSVRDTLLARKGLKQISNDSLFYMSISGLVAIYPDTLVWTKDFPYTYNEPIVNYYFTHPAYNNYPVVGISWLQANAYCLWRTNQMNEAIIKSGGTIEDTYPSFRLPSEAEWEYAALSHDIKKDETRIFNVRIFPWDGYKLTDKNGKYRANFGPIKDQNGLWIKEFGEEIPIKNTKMYDFIYTSPVKYFGANLFKLYDMAGNVAEWTSDAARIISFEDLISNDDKISASDDLETAMAKIIKRKKERNYPGADSTGKYNERIIKEEALLEMHDAKIIEACKEARIVKGGSWANGPTYMICGRREAYPENKGSSRIGFRVAMIKVGKFPTN